MKISGFVKKDFVSASAFAGVADLKNLLLQHYAIVIMEEEQFFGVLTATDIVRKPHIIAIDCICDKTKIEIDSSLNNALSYMKRDFTEVLPVFEKKKFIGLIFKSDILEYLNEHCNLLQNEIVQHSEKIKKQNSEFKIKIRQQRQELEKITEQRTKELIDLVETKERFIRIIIHELRSPFNGILGFLELLKKNIQKYNIDKIEKFLTIIHQSASTTFELLVNLSAWLDTKNDRIPFNPENIGIYEIVTDEILTTSLLLEQKQIKLINNIPEDLHAYVDQNMMKTIFRNLIVNATKYTTANGEISISAIENEQFIEITVQDTGIGLSQKHVNKLFESEGLTSLVGTANEKGTGMGLLLCKEFVEIGGGKIWVESSLGNGSEFKFLLPKEYEQIAAY